MLSECSWKNSGKAVISMNNILEYKGYYTRIEYSTEDRVLYGVIEGIRDLVNFECENAAGIELEFHKAVDDYLTFCADLGQAPDKPYKGVFNVRISPELHKKAAIAAFEKGETLNAFVSRAISEAVELSYNVKTHYEPAVMAEN